MDIVNVKACLTDGTFRTLNFARPMVVSGNSTKFDRGDALDALIMNGDRRKMLQPADERPSER